MGFVGGISGWGWVGLGGVGWGWLGLVGVGWGWLGLVGIVWDCVGVCGASGFVRLPLGAVGGGGGGGGWGGGGGGGGGGGEVCCGRRVLSFASSASPLSSSAWSMSSRPKGTARMSTLRSSPSAPHNASARKARETAGTLRTAASGYCWRTVTCASASNLELRRSVSTCAIGAGGGGGRGGASQLMAYHLIVTASLTSYLVSSI